MALMTTVTGECHPFDDAWLTQLDAMSKESAIIWVTKHLDACREMRNRYEQNMMTSQGAEFESNLHAWCIDNNNIVRYKRLLMQIEAE